MIPVVAERGQVKAEMSDSVSRVVGCLKTTKTSDELLNEIRGQFRNRESGEEHEIENGNRGENEGWNFSE